MVKFEESSVTNGIVQAKVRYSVGTLKGDRCVVIEVDTRKDGINLGALLPWHWENKSDCATGKIDFGRAIIESRSDHFRPALARCPS